MVIGTAGWFRWFAAALLLVVASFGMMGPVSAADTVTVRMRPIPVPFVDGSGRTKTLIVHFYLTLHADAVRDICRRRAEIKSKFLVTVYNRKLDGQEDRQRLTLLAQDLYRVLANQFGQKAVVATHLALGNLKQTAKANQIQERLEQVEDCTTVRTISTSAVSATLDSLNRPIGTASNSAVSAPTKPSPIPLPTRVGAQSDKPVPADDIEQAPADSLTIIPATPVGPTPDVCTVELRSLWRSGWITIDGERYWLSLTTTLDPDGDGKADDVRFLLMQSDGGELNRTYFELHPKGSAVRIPGLSLDDPQILSGLCLGAHTFDKPATPIAQFARSDKPNLATEVAGRITGNKPVVAVIIDDSAAEFWRWVAAGVSISAVLLAITVLIVFMIHLRNDRRRKADRRRKRRRDQERRSGDAKMPKVERRKTDDRRDKADRRETDTRREQADRRD